MKIYVFVNIFLCFSALTAQVPPDDNVTIEAGETNLSLNQPFVLSVIIKNNTSRPSVLFPAIQGLAKRSASATSTTSTIGGKTVLIQTISQQYFAQQEGEIKVPPIIVQVDGRKVKYEGITLVFRKNSTATETAVKENKNPDMLPELGEENAEKVFLSTQISKSSVYIREGFSLRFSLYVAKNAPINMDFYQLDTQLQTILKQLRPATCWEENVGIEEIIQRDVIFNGAEYTEYRMYQAVFFPLTLQTVTFPSVTLDMLIRDTEADKGNEGKALRTFRTRPMRVQVRALPYHPMKDQAAVGQYRLRERMTTRKIAAGESLRYLFTITGQGNLATISAPTIPESKAFDFYPPDVTQTIRRSYEEVNGEKTFDYFIVAKQKGTYPLGRFFQWVYFDPKRARYDTLRSSQTIEVVGESLQMAVLEEGKTSIYDNLEDLNTNIVYTDYQAIIQSLTNIVVIALLGVMIWIFRK